MEKKFEQIPLTRTVLGIHKYYELTIMLNNINDKNKKSISPLSIELRRVPLEVIQCRHCEKLIQTSDRHLCDAFLCQVCFDAREEYRKEFKREHKGRIYTTEKTEWGVLGDQYGNHRLVKSVVCAFCSVIYELVPSDFIGTSVDEQKKYYDDSMIRFKQYVEFIKATEPDKKIPIKPPFTPIIFDYKHAPKGWKNEILCKMCFDNLQVGYEDELKQMNEVETERIKARKLQIWQEQEMNRRHTKRLFIFGLILIPFIFLDMCTDNTSVQYKEPSELYFRE